VPEDDPLLTTAELARRLGVSARAVNQWMQNGDITPELITPGRHARWREGRVREQLRVLAEQRRKADDER
jgi:excisionase family DNA binding protein